MTLDEFRECVRQEFPFLQTDDDDAEVPLPKRKFVNEFIVCLSNGRTRIRIERIRWGYAIDVRLASVDQSTMRDPTY